MKLKLAWIMFIASLLLFLSFEYYLISLYPPTFLFYVITLLTATSLVFITLLSRKIEIAILALAIYYLFTKISFLSLLPKSAITLYLDSYVIFQISSQIISSGHLLIEPGIYTMGAYTIAQQPLWPIFSAILSEVTGISLFHVLRNIGVLFAPIIPFAVYLLYSALNSFNNEISKLSMILLCSSPWLIFFLTWGHYSNASIIFLGILSYLLLTNKIARLPKLVIYTIVTIALVFTHFYMTVVFLIILCLYMSLLLFTDKSKFSQSANLGILFATIFVFYLLWFGSIYVDSLTFFFRYFSESIETGNPTKGFEFYFASKTSYPHVTTSYPPLYVTALRYGGAMVWSILLLFSLYFLLRGYYSIRYVSFYIIFGFVGLILAIPYIFDPKFGTDLFHRSLYFFGLLSAAPLSAIGYIAIKNRTTSKNRTTCSLIKALSALLLILIVNFGLIMIPNDFQSWNYPIRGGEDLRLYQTEWSYAGFFASTHIEKYSSVCGLRQGVGKIGYFASLNYYELQPSASNLIPLLKPEQWEKLPSLRMEYCFVRKSITLYPEIRDYIVDKDVFQKVYLSTNVIYSTTDVIGMKLK